MEDVRLQCSLATSDAQSLLSRLVQYIKRQWILKISIGTKRLSVRESDDRTNNGVESFHAAFRRRVLVPHPNLFVFLSHLQNATTDNMNDLRRLKNHKRIRRPKKKQSVTNDTRIRQCINRYDSGDYTKLEFLRAVSHCAEKVLDQLQTLDEEDSDTEYYDIDDQTMQTTTGAVDSTSNRTCVVCLNADRVPIALVPCGHSLMCGQCTQTIMSNGQHCPLCRSPIAQLLNIYV